MAAKGQLTDKGWLSEEDKVMKLIREGHNFVLKGGAGSGKTYSLVQILSRIQAEKPWARIACITYTNAAAIEIRNRVSNEKLWVSTIHDFLWRVISSFQREMKETLIHLVNNSEERLWYPDKATVDMNDFPSDITYQEYTKLGSGTISHDEVLLLANRMFRDYPKLCDILIDSYSFIFVDEYQDTDELVMELLLSHLSGQNITKKNMIGFFGDTMQSVYKESDNDRAEWFENNVVEVQKNQNRRNPIAVINLANTIRTDGLTQTPSDDENAPNMQNGIPVEGSITFLHSKSLDIDKVRESRFCAGWDFSNPKETKELRLTHNLIADDAGFLDLLSVYDKDPITKFRREFEKEARNQKYEFDKDAGFETVLKGMVWNYNSKTHCRKSHLDVFLQDIKRKECFNYVKDWPYLKVKKIYLDKEMLLDDAVRIDAKNTHKPRKSAIIRHLVKIQEILLLYQTKDFHDLIRKTSFRVYSTKDKQALKKIVDQCTSQSNEMTIKEMIDYADSTKLCVKDDAFNMYIQEHEYEYWRVLDIPFERFAKCYHYIEGKTVLSTQHKIKGQEFKNVLVILHNGDWAKYNFEYLLNEGIKDTLKAGKKKSFNTILNRTKKLFYVCCTRTKENLVVYYPSPTQEVIESARNLFGLINCYCLDD
ncbi:UvrD-helicase domain-containing protein [Eubacterium maltosivorans]|nr:UvrD-helicase domain-containing protein [Eubacterium maltosivorans]